MSFHNSSPFLNMKKSFEAKAMKNVLPSNEEESPLLNAKMLATKNISS